MYLDTIQKIDEKIELIKEKTAALRKENEIRARYISRYQAQRACQNLIGRFSIYCSAGQYKRAAGLFSETSCIYFQRSDVGIYEGREKVFEYFAAQEEKCKEGEWGFFPTTSPIIEIAQDEGSAQGMWFINGSQVIRNPEDRAQAADIWRNDKLAVEFIKEDGEWKILRMTICEETRALYHKSMGEYKGTEDYPKYDVFPAPSRASDRHDPFTLTRDSHKNLTTPEPYYTYSDLSDHF